MSGPALTHPGCAHRPCGARALGVVPVDRPTGVGALPDARWPAGSARLAGHVLGGKDHFAADRAVAAALAEADTAWEADAAASRLAVLATAARLGRDGIGQFLDLGCGLTTGQDHSALAPLHSAVLPHAPTARIVYADRDPMVLVHARALLRLPAASGRLRHLHVDLTRAHRTLAVLRGPRGTGFDWSRPVAVVLSDVCHELTDHQVERLLAVLHRALPPASAVLVSHRTPAGDDTRAAAVAAAHARAALPWHPRTPAQFAALARPWNGVAVTTAGAGCTVAVLTAGRSGL
ncbi:SAM-dependent methyltransferase [Kitasatospora sp. NPDC089797]|uniref:SAM-dependent methyltransferase n=1 Tax=Kitasatospora sp. NPDC089797 TaxID=3155298 RepID=UPI00342534D0